MRATHAVAVVGDPRDWSDVLGMLRKVENQMTTNMSPVIVLVTRGKRESVDYAKVLLYETPQLAREACQRMNTGPKKYWTRADIVQDAEEIELSSPEDDA